MKLVEYSVAYSTSVPDRFSDPCALIINRLLGFRLSLISIRSIADDCGARGRTSKSIDESTLRREREKCYNCVNFKHTLPRDCTVVTRRETFVSRTKRCARAACPGGRDILPRPPRGKEDTAREATGTRGHDTRRP